MTAVGLITLFWASLNATKQQDLKGILAFSTVSQLGMIMEMRDGVLTSFTFWEFIRFMLFMPTFSSGPIDRFRRFNDDYF